MHREASAGGLGHETKDFFESGQSSGCLVQASLMAHSHEHVSPMQQDITSGSQATCLHPTDHLRPLADIALAGPPLH